MGTLPTHTCMSQLLKISIIIIAIMLLFIIIILLFWGYDCSQDGRNVPISVQNGVDDCCDQHDWCHQYHHPPRVAEGAIQWSIAAHMEIDNTGNNYCAEKFSLDNKVRQAQLRVVPLHNRNIKFWWNFRQYWGSRLPPNIFSHEAAIYIIKLNPPPALLKYAWHRLINGQRKWFFKFYIRICPPEDHEAN